MSLLIQFFNAEKRACTSTLPWDNPDQEIIEDEATEHGNAWFNAGCPITEQDRESIHETVYNYAMSMQEGFLYFKKFDRPKFRYNWNDCCKAWEKADFPVLKNDSLARDTA
jgi:hypothetical protein